MIDVGQERSLTPGALRGPFLDSAGASLVATPVLETVIGHLRREAEVGGYRAAADRAEDLAGVPASLARLLRCDAGEIALTDSATRAWSIFVSALRLGPGDRVLIGGNEYASNAIALLQRARADGCSIERLPETDDGAVDLEATRALVDERVRLVSIVPVATNSGAVRPVRELAALARSAGAAVIVDACQAVGQLDLDVRSWGADAVSGTGRKWLRAPRGTGFLYVRAALAATLEPAVADLRGATWTGADDYALRPDAARFEFWEHDVAGRLGFGAAVDHLLALGPAAVEQAVRDRAARLRDGLAAIPGVTVHDRGQDLCGIVTFTVAGVAPAAVKAGLAERAVMVSVSEASSALLDMTARGLTAVVRASPHYFVDDGDLERAVAAVRDLAVTGT